MNSLHLYGFNINNTFFSVHDEVFERNDLDVKNKITEFLFSKGQKCIYIYDFGDNWEHEIEIIDILDRENIQYPKCISGKRNDPPEDCGGIPGYEEIIEALKNKNKSENREILRWLGNYDPEKFDIDKVNKALLNPENFQFF